MRSSVAEPKGITMTAEPSKLPGTLFCICAGQIDDDITLCTWSVGAGLTVQWKSDGHHHFVRLKT